MVDLLLIGATIIISFIVGAIFLIFIFLYNSTKDGLQTRGIKKLIRKIEKEKNIPHAEACKEYINSLKSKSEIKGGNINGRQTKAEGIDIRRAIRPVQETRTPETNKLNNQRPSSNEPISNGADRISERETGRTIIRTPEIERRIESINRSSKRRLRRIE